MIATSLHPAVAGALAVLLVAVAGLHVARLVGPAGRRSRDVDLVHAAMGGAMAVLLVTGGLGTRAGWLLGAVFAAAALWFAVRSLDPLFGSVRANLRQSLCCAAMVAMVVVPLVARPRSGSGMADMPGAHAAISAAPLLLGVLVVQLLLAAWTAVEARRSHHAGGQLATTLGGACMVALML